MKTTTWFIVATLAIGVVPAFSGEQPTADELLTAYQRSVEHLARARIECVEKHPERQLGENDRVTETHERTITRDGSRWKVAQVSRMVRTVNGTKREGGVRQEMIVGEHLIEVGQMPDGTVRISAFLDPTVVKTVQIGTQTVKRDPTRAHWNALGGAEVLFGRFPGDDDQPLWDVMREAPTLTLSPDTEDIDSVPTYVLKSVGKFGEHTVWIDRAHGSLPRRIEIRKQLGNLLDGTQLGSRIGVADDPPPQPGQRRLPTQPPDFRAFSARIDDIQIENKNGVFMMTAWKSEEKFTFGNGKTGGRRSEHSVGVVDFKPESSAREAFRPGIEIPDKTRVDVRDGLTGAEYEWVGGQIQVRGGN